MNQSVFKREIMRAKAMIAAGDNLNYWLGYQRGLRRKYYGQKFGNDNNHELWLSAAESSDQSRRDLGRGYRNGYKEGRIGRPE